MARKNHGVAELRSHLAARLSERRAEMELVARARVQAVSGQTQIVDPIYSHGLQAAIPAAFDYALQGFENDEDPEPVPVALLAQARLAARSGISLDTVLRRYFAGFTLLTDFVMQEAAVSSCPPAALQQLMRIQGARFDRLVTGVTEEHGKERVARPGSREEQRVKHVEALLDGELMAGEQFDYDFERTHVGLVAAGRGAPDAIRALATELDYRLLLVRPGERMTWAWLATAREVDLNRLCSAAAQEISDELHLAVGEPTPGLAGWRLTHRQAGAALAVAIRGGQAVVRYGEVALLASTLGDDVFAASLRQLYLAPLTQGRDRGATLLATLRAYFAADRNVSSTAAAIGVSRQTVINRLKASEELLGCVLGDSAAELEAALRLEALDHLPMEAAPDAMLSNHA